MPTGYTAGVQSGEVTEFSDFAMSCARAFGACIDMRDDPADKEIPYHFEPSNYYAEQIEEHEKELNKLQSMTADEIELAAKKEYESELQKQKELLAERKEQLIRYDVMLKKARAWTPPTKDHEHFKEFMVKQLTDSIEFDCTYDIPDPKPIEPHEWFLAQIEYHEDAIARYKEDEQKEIERVKGRNKWLRDLRKSLNLPYF